MFHSDHVFKIILKSAYHPSQAIHTSHPTQAIQPCDRSTGTGCKASTGGQDRAQIASSPSDLADDRSMTFTCTADDCGHRSSHEFSKRSYTSGIVLVQCPSCKNRQVYITTTLTPGISLRITWAGSRRVQKETLKPLRICYVHEVKRSRRVK